VSDTADLGHARPGLSGLVVPLALLLLWLRLRASRTNHRRRSRQLTHATPEPGPPAGGVAPVVTNDSLGQGSSAAVVCQGLVGWAANTGSVNRHATARGALAVGALGVVFGDIGTSPLYTVQTVFNPHDPHPVAVSTESIFGIVSLIFWSVTIIVTVTYVYFLSRIELHRGDTPGMSGWRKRLFLATSRITADAAEYFQLPRERTVIMGSRIEL
jgi:hypothetical protein